MKSAFYNNFKLWCILQVSRYSEKGDKLVMTFRGVPVTQMTKTELIKVLEYQYDECERWKQRHFRATDFLTSRTYHNRTDGL